MGLLFVAFLVPRANAEAPIQPVLTLASQADISVYVRSIQQEYGLGDSFFNTLNCESGGFQNIQSDIVQNGIREDSWGVAQINIPSHPDITKTDALNIQFAVNWAAEQFIAGNADEWTCYRRLYGSGGT